MILNTSGKLACSCLRSAFCTRCGPSTMFSPLVLGHFQSPAAGVLSERGQVEDPHPTCCPQTLGHQDPSVRIDGRNGKLYLACKFSSYMCGAVANLQMTLVGTPCTQEGPMHWTETAESILLLCSGPKSKRTVCGCYTEPLS